MVNSVSHASDHSSGVQRSESDHSMSIGKPPPNAQLITAPDIWMLGITIVIGGQYFGWNLGLSCGFGAFAIATFLMGSGYFCLILCTSEISSGLPFAGGAYGLARVSLGYYLGFVVGCSETIEYILYTAASALALGRMIETLFNTDGRYGPVIWFMFYVSSTAIHIHGGRTFWLITYGLAIISFIIELIYLLGALSLVDFNTYAGSVAYVYDRTVNRQDYFVGGGKEFMSALFNASWFYVGVESLAFASDLTIEPKKNMPRGSLSCMTTLLILSVLMLFICCSVPVTDGTSLSSVGSPLEKGFSLMFGISGQAATLLSLPATFATAYGFMFPYGKLMHSLAESNLLPSPLKQLTSYSGTPYVALITGSTIGYLFCIVVYFYNELENILFSICILSAFLGYISQGVGYIAIQTKFQSIKREFHSPLGIYGAAYCIAVFSLCALSVVAFQSNQYALIAVFTIQLSLSIYYFGYAKAHQTFSPEESKIMFVAHVITHNQAATKNRYKQYRAKGNKTNSKVAPLVRQGSRGILVGPSSLGKLSSLGQDSSAVDDGPHRLASQHALVSGDSFSDMKESTNDSQLPMRRFIPLPILPPIKTTAKETIHIEAPKPVS